MIRRTPSRKALIFFLEGLMSSTPFGYPAHMLSEEVEAAVTCVMTVFSGESSNPRSPPSHRMDAELLHEMGYSLQANAKTIEGTSHPDRNAQFEHTNKRVRLYLAKGDPVISVETN
jgi:hypothetical protein